jgi:CheY-like chemotaxis protein/anti-sigma regulatory factor (Ser/Thr protein kinase)
MITDKQLLRQILHNLLSNAVKFTEQGQVELRIAIAEHRTPGAGAVVGFSVTDTGIGISEGNLATIFSAFQQGDGTTSRRYGGAGLGLAISREVAAQLGGEVAVHSDPGRGSTYSLYLPPTPPGAAEPAPGNPAAPSHSSPDDPGTSANGESPGSTTHASRTSPDGADAAGPDRATPAAPAAVPIGPTAAAARHDSLRGRKILLVDDDPRNAFALTNVLELYGLTVVPACDGRKAIGQLAAGDIDLVLMDVMMPQLDGHQTMREIRQMPQFAHLPVIAVTARAMHGDREKSLAAGASDYVTKPVDIEELLNRMEQWLSPAPESPPAD